jgi:hypothetical protein
MRVGGRFQLLISKVSMSSPLVSISSCSLLIMAIIHISGAATTASRLGQPDLAIATLNDFVEVTDLHILAMCCVIPDKHNLCLVGADGLQPESNDPSHRGCGYWVRHHFLSHRFIVTNRS